MRRLFIAGSVILLLLLNTLILIGPMMLIALLKLVLPGKALRTAFSRGVMWVAETWAEIDKLIFATLTPTVWDIRGGEGLRRDRSYLVVSNHQSCPGWTSRLWSRRSTARRPTSSSSSSRN